MRIIARSTCLAFILTGAAALGAGDASAQLANLIPSRVGGTLATRASGSLFMANARPDKTVGFAERSGFTAAGWTQWGLWTLKVGIENFNSQAVNIVTAPATVLRSDNVAVVLGRADDNRLYTTQESSPGSRFFNDWVRMPLATSTGGTVPTFTARPALARRADSLLSVYAMDGGGNVWEAIRSGSTWRAWLSLGHPNGVTLRNSPVLAMMSNGGYLLFAAGTNNHLFARRQSTTDWSWGGWVDLGGAVAANDAIAAGLDSNGRVSVFINNTSSTISQLTQTAQNANTWPTSWTTLSGVTGQSRPTVAVQGDGRLALFFTASGNNLNWRVQTAPGATTWSNWTNIQSGAATSSPAALTDANGVIHLVLTGTSGYYYERAQVSPSSTSWTQWQAGYLGGPYAVP
jgi:hypothetical protein